ncbi:Caspase domain containing protein [Lactarius tabidus]
MHQVRDERGQGPQLAGALPDPNVPGNGAYMYPNASAPSQQPQPQVGHSRYGPPPPPPPRNMPVQPDQARIPQALVVPHQQGMGYDNTQVNNHSRPAFPHPHAGAPHTAQTPPYGSNGVANPGRLASPEPPPYSQAPVPSQLLTPRGLQPYARPLSGEPYQFAHPPDFGRTPLPLIPTPHVGPSFTSPPLARPQQLYDVGRYQAQTHPPASFTPSMSDHATFTEQPGHSRRRVHPPPQFPVPPTYRIIDAVPQPYPPRARQKALVVGIDYSRHRDRDLRLKYGVYDANQMARFLQEHLHFHPDNIRILTDDRRDQRRNLPTAANILAGMRWLVEGAQPGDSLFFYFSGHATQIEDNDEDELDGFDECMCAMDYDDRRNPPTGVIVDDTMHDIMVKPLPRGCRLTAVFDCCTSGTLLDLPYIYGSNDVFEQNRPDIDRRKASDADVISLSACMDRGKAYEVRGSGALREAFIDYMTRFGNRGTYLQVIESLCSHMAANGLLQFPQLSSSHWIDTDRRFTITG